MQVYVQRRPKMLHIYRTQFKIICFDSSVRDIEIVAGYDTSCRNFRFVDYLQYKRNVSVRHCTYPCSIGLTFNQAIVIFP